MRKLCNDCGTFESMRATRSQLTSSELRRERRCRGTVTPISDSQPRSYCAPSSCWLKKDFTQEQFEGDISKWKDVIRKLEITQSGHCSVFCYKIYYIWTNLSNTAQWTFENFQVSCNIIWRFRWSGRTKRQKYMRIHVFRFHSSHHVRSSPLQMFKYTIYITDTYTLHFLSFALKCFNIINIDG